MSVGFHERNLSSLTWAAFLRSAKNFDAHGIIEIIVPNCLPPDEQACCQELWVLLQGEANALGDEFTGRLLQ